MPKLLDPKQIGKDIDELKKSINNPKTPPDIKKQLQEALEIAEHDYGRALKSQKKREEAKANKKEIPKVKSAFSFGGKNLNDATTDELMEAFRTRLEKSKQNPTIKTASVISKTSDSLLNVATQVTQAVVDAGATGADASAVAEKVGGIVEDALKKIRVILKPHLENADMVISSQAKKDLESFEQLATELKTKY